MKICDFKAFTLAEVMIVLTVIGVLTAILLPVARQSMPDEDLMKFKKAHNTLGTVIRELVTSDEYYKDGLLAIDVNGNYVKNSKYFCETFSDILNTKEVNCIDETKGKGTYGYDTVFDLYIWPEHGLDYKIIVDQTCKKASLNYGNQIISADNINYFEVGAGFPFGASIGEYFDDLDGNTCIGVANEEHCNNSYFLEKYNSFYKIYKMFCIDIDGVPEIATEDDCVNECPFGYGIRADGKILTGKRADEWLARDINEE